MSMKRLAASDSAVAEEAWQYLTFSVLNKTMAIAILDVEEIIEVAKMTRVPMAAGSVRGVINLRGNVVPVIDLNVRLGGESSVLSRRSCIVLVSTVADGERHSMGMLVDAVSEILEISSAAVQKTPDFGTDIAPEFIDRMGRVGNEFVVLLNLHHVLDIDDLSSGSPPRQ